MCDKVVNENTEKQGRNDFLINMYNQAFNNINRHIILVWQTISILVGAFLSLFFTEKYNISIWLTSLLLIVYMVWMIAHLIDGNHWFQRNLHIITNIEKNFLTKDDINLIHNYFSKNIKSNKMIESFKIQIILASVIWILMLMYLYYKATLTLSLCLFFIYFLISVILVILLRIYYKSNCKKIEKLINDSPGKELEP